MEGAIERAEEMLEEAERRAKTFESRIRVAAKEGMEKRSSMRAEAVKAMNARIDENRGQMQTRLEKALEKVENERQQALKELEAQAEQIAESTATKLLGRAAS